MVVASGVCKHALVHPGCRFFQTAPAFFSTSLSLASYDTSLGLIEGVIGRGVVAARQPGAFCNDLPIDVILAAPHCERLIIGSASFLRTPSEAEKQVLEAVAQSLLLCVIGTIFSDAPRPRV
jgi:hypothetical protein